MAGMDDIDREHWAALSDEERAERIKAAMLDMQEALLGITEACRSATGAIEEFTAAYRRGISDR